MKKTSFGVVVITAFILSTIAALAADEQPLSAAAGLTTDNFTLILKIGVPSGLLSALLTLIGVFLSNRTAQKNNREKIAAETENISRQLNQRQAEFEIQTKMQIESLHSDEMKKACWDFLASADPQLIIQKQFCSKKLLACIQPLYIYCKSEYYSYFINLITFSMIKDLESWGKRIEPICEKLIILEEHQKHGNNTYKMRKSRFQSRRHTSFNYSKEIEKLRVEKKPLDDDLFSYSEHYHLALNAAKKMIWNEPIEKAQPLKLKELPDEDDI